MCMKETMTLNVMEEATRFIFYYLLHKTTYFPPQPAQTIIKFFVKLKYLFIKLYLTFMRL